MLYINNLRKRKSGKNMDNFENLHTEHPEALEGMRKDLGDPEQLETSVDIEALREACAGNETLERFFQNMLEHFYGYTETVWEFQEVLDKKNRGELTETEYKEEFGNIDMTRHRSHEALISSVDILARAMKKFKLDTSWIIPLKDSPRIKYSILALQTIYLEIIKSMNQKEGVKA